MDEGCLQFIPEKKLLTRQEKEFLKTLVSRSLIKSWSTDMVEKATLINADTVDAMFKDKLYGWANFNKRYGESFYSFSGPFFFRNNTRCLFYSDYSRGWRCDSGAACLVQKK